MALLMAGTVVSAQQPPQPKQPQIVQGSPEWYARFRGEQSQPVEPFRIVGNIYYVGARNIASYLITTPDGHILMDTGTTTMTNVIKDAVEKLGFKVSDIKIMLSSHAHFDHVEGHAAMQKLTGAKVMAMQGDAEALEAGKDNSAGGFEGWTPVKVDRVLKDGDTVTLGGSTLRAVWAPGHTQGATAWFMTVDEKGKKYNVAFLGGTTPNNGVALFDNPRHRTVVDDTRRTLTKLKSEAPPDIYLVGHPQNMLNAKMVERIKAGETPHPLVNPQGWTKQLDDQHENFEKRVTEERAKGGTR
jgi:metallo-beta-lactamase class B